MALTGLDSLPPLDREVLRAVEQLEHLVTIALGPTQGGRPGVTVDEVSIRLFVAKEDEEGRDRIRAALGRLERHGLVHRLPVPPGPAAPSQWRMDRENLVDFRPRSA